MKLLDLSKFEKIAHNDKTATMRHKDGHTMTILIAALPRLHQEQLKRIRLAGGGDPGNQADEGSSSTQDDSASAQPGDSDNAPDATAAPMQFPAAEALAAQTQPTPAMPGNLTNVQNALNVPSQAVQMGGAAADLKQKIDTAAAQGMAQIAQQKEAVEQSAAKQIQGTAAEFQNHVDAFDQWNREHPYDNMAYLNNMDTRQRMTNALSLFLGGFAGQGRGNIILDYMNHQIQNNIQTQIQEHQTQRNIYGAYQDLYHNQNASIELTRASLLRQLAAASDHLTATLGTPQAAQANMALKANLLQQSAEAIKNAAVYKLGFGGGAPGETQGATMPAGAPGPAQPAPGGSMAPVGPEMKGGTPAFGPASADAIGVYQPKPILAPNAASIARQFAARAQAGDPVATAQLPRIQEQYARAQQADEVLSRARDLYSDLAGNRGSTGGWINRQIGGVSGGGEGIVGAALGKAGQFAGDLYSQAADRLNKMHNAVYPHDEPIERSEAEMNRNYERAEGTLGDMLRKIYPGIGGSEMTSKMNALLPDKNDSKEQVTKKMKSFEDLVRTSGEFNLLKDNGMMRK